MCSIILPMAKRKKEDEKEMKSLADAVRGMNERKKIALGIFLSAGVIILIITFVCALLEVSGPPEISEEEYCRLLVEFDGRKWSIKRGDAALIAKAFGIFKPLGARTEKKKSLLLFVLYDEESEYVIRFGYKDSFLSGFVSGAPYNLYFSYGKDDRERVLSLSGEAGKFTFYEN